MNQDWIKDQLKKKEERDRRAKSGIKEEKVLKRHEKKKR